MYESLDFADLDDFVDLVSLKSIDVFFCLGGTAGGVIAFGDSRPGSKLGFPPDPIQIFSYPGMSFRSLGGLVLGSGGGGGGGDVGGGRSSDEPEAR